MGPEYQLSLMDKEYVRVNGCKGYIPVTPAIVRGCAPKTENMNAAMKEDMRTSAMPYCWVVSMRSSEKAMPGKTLYDGSGIPRV